MLRRTTVGAVLVVALIALAGCVDSMRSTPIPDVIDNPADFDKKFVKVEGTVSKMVVDAGTGGSTRYYVLETRIQRAGKTPPYYVLRVLTPTHEIPEEGKTLWVKGFVKDVPGEDPILDEKEREPDRQGLVWMIAFGAVGLVLVVLVIILIKTLMSKPQSKGPTTTAPTGRTGGPSPQDSKPTEVAYRPPPQTPAAPAEGAVATKNATRGYLQIERGQCTTPDQPGPRLIIYQDAEKGLLLGRGSKAGLCFEGKAVSREHAMLYWHADTFTLQNTCDVDKTWTRVDGKELQPHETVKLAHDTRVEIGPEVELVFQHMDHQA